MNSTLKKTLWKSASALAVGAILATGALAAPTPMGPTMAWEGDGGYAGKFVHGQQGQGGQGQGGQGGQGQGGQGQGQGGPGDDSEGQGPRAGQGSEGAGTRPPWSGEGLPDVEIGRLNVARSPDHVLDRAYDEAMLSLADMAAFYNLSLSEMITELSLNWDNLTILDSPLQNLAIFRDALDGGVDLSAYGITNDTFTIMAVTLGVASDKTQPITADTVFAVSVIFGMPMSQSDATALAAAAEAIRIAVLAGHG